MLESFRFGISLPGPATVKTHCGTLGANTKRFPLCSSFVELGSRVVLNKLTFSRDAQASLRLLRQTPLLQWSPSDFCRLWCAATTTMIGRSIHSCYHSMINVDFLCDDPLFVSCSTIFGSVYDGRHGRTTITCDAWQLTTKVIWRPARILTCCHKYSFVFLCSLYDMPCILL